MTSMNNRVSYSSTLLNSNLPFSKTAGNRSDMSSSFERLMEKHESKRESQNRYSDEKGNTSSVKSSPEKLISNASDTERHITQDSAPPPQMRRDDEQQNRGEAQPGDEDRQSSQAGESQTNTNNIGNINIETINEHPGGESGVEGFIGSHTQSGFHVPEALTPQGARMDIKEFMSLFNQMINNPKSLADLQSKALRFHLQDGASSLMQLSLSQNAQGHWNIGLGADTANKELMGQYLAKLRDKIKQHGYEIESLVLADAVENQKIVAPDKEKSE